jgi:hypothetical protein
MALFLHLFFIFPAEVANVKIHLPHDKDSILARFPLFFWPCFGAKRGPKPTNCC